MPYALGAVNVQAGQAYTVPVGSAGTVGAVVCANESPYAVKASVSATGAPGQWIVAQTADLIACDVSGFNGMLTFTTDNYLSNANSAPSFQLYLTAFAPGEAIRGTYPAPLMRLANGVATVTNDPATTIEQDMFTPYVLAGITPSGTGTQIYGTTAGIAFTRQADSALRRTAVGATAQGPFTPSTTYYHDLNPDGTFSLGTSHSSQPNYLTIATFTTDSVNIITVTDTRVMSTILFNSMANVANSPGLVLYNLHIDKDLQVDNQINVQGAFHTTSGIGGTTGWLISSGADSELEFTPDTGTGSKFIMFNVPYGGASPAFAIGSQSHVLLPSAWIDDNGVLHAPAPVVLTTGNQASGKVYIQLDAVSGRSYGNPINWPCTMTNTPTAISFSSVSSGGVSAAGAFGVDLHGAFFQVTANATGNIFYDAVYTTAGNCLLAVDAQAQTFDHHCEACDAVRRAIPLAEAQHQPCVGGRHMLTYTCPTCGAVESFNCALTAAAEQITDPQGSGAYATTYGAQATLIRALMTALGLEVTA